VNTNMQELFICSNKWSNRTKGWIEPSQPAGKSHPVFSYANDIIRYAMIRIKQLSYIKSLLKDFELGNPKRGQFFWFGMHYASLRKQCNYPSGCLTQ